MREYDENVQHYAPVLRRIIFLVAVITAVPVVLWTITAFVRAYVGPPQLPTFRPLAASQLPASDVPQNSVQVAAQTTNVATDARPALLDIKKPAASDTPQTALSMSAPAMSGASASPSAAVAAPVSMPPPPFAATRATTAITAAPPNAVLANVAPAQAATAPLSNPAAIAPVDSGPDAQPASIAAPSRQRASNDNTAGNQPAGTPLKGKIPLPLRRPNPAGSTNIAAHVAFAAAPAPAGIPLPRARPASAPEPAPVSDTPHSAYDPSQIH
jgi:hypothetical protein